MEEERKQWNRLLKQVALKAGVSPDEVLSWPSEKLQPYLAEMIAQLESGLRENTRQRIIMNRTGDLMGATSMPAGMTVGEGVAQGYLSPEDLDAAKVVTEEGIDREIEQAAD